MSYFKLFGWERGWVSKGMFIPKGEEGWISRKIKLRSKKGDVGLIEMIMVLLVVFVLLVIGIYFYYSGMIFSISNRGEELKDINLKLLLSVVPSMPEVKCSKNLVEKECIDTLKLFGFKSLVLKNKEWYSSKFGSRVNIKIEQIYPVVANDIECTMGNYPNCKKWTLYGDGKAKTWVSTVVSLYYPGEKRHKIGKLYVGV